MSKTISCIITPMMRRSLITSMLQIQRTHSILSDSKHTVVGTRIENLSHRLTTMVSPRFYSSQASSVSILELCDHKTIKTVLASLKDPGTLDTLADAVLGKNIQVELVALQNNIVVYRGPGNLRGITRTQLPTNLPKEIYTGEFTPGEDDIIEHNWEKLLAMTNISEEAAHKYVFNVPKKVESDGKKQNILGYYLAQGLPRHRLATEVFHRARLLRCRNSFREFSPTEDKTILKFVETEGGKWDELARLLRRSCGATVMNRHKVLIEGKKRKGEYTLEESLVILTEVVKANNNILENRIVTNNTWKKIEDQLQRSHRSVVAHWRRVVEPTLFMHKAGTLGKDIREDLLNHLLEQGINYSQEVDWEGIIKLPQFTGTTAAYLQMSYQNMVAHANTKYPGTNKAERTTEMVKKWWDSRESNAGTEAMNEMMKEKLRKREDAILQHFHKLCIETNMPLK